MKGRLSHLLDGIRFVLLDLDGTLLDRHFDDHFWQHLLPARFAEKNGISFEAARADLLARFRREEGSLRWTDLDYWSEELGIDIPALKEQVKHLIAVHPHVIEFLGHVRRLGKTSVLVTNAHFKVLGLKLRRTDLGPWLDRVYGSGGFGFPKERPEFWECLTGELGPGYEKESLLVDDTEAVLETARAFGVRHVIFKDRANSRLPSRISPRFPTIQGFDELMG